ncbi:hypothetical protein [Mangrovicoccus ximenensis]|uniref:hypothetical protein n=1 Tax=Mangrovicoccus ximenensis TaxID=1911570 RepID=UPI0011AE5D8D|nr:hypothetical protein [Mangrovicoccus ximenensis]
MEDQQGLLGDLRGQPLGQQPPAMDDVVPRMAARHRTMGGGGHREVQRLDQVERLGHVPPERPHDVVEMALEGKPDVARRVAEQPPVAEMAAQEVAGEEERVLFGIGALRLGPADMGRDQEAQGAAAGIDAAAGADRDHAAFAEAVLRQRPQHAEAARGEMDPGARRGVTGDSRTHPPAPAARIAATATPARTLRRLPGFCAFCMW